MSIFISNMFYYPSEKRYNPHCYNTLHNNSDATYPISVTYAKEESAFKVADPMMRVYGKLSLNDKTFIIITSNAYEENCQELIKTITKLNSTGRLEFESKIKDNSLANCFDLKNYATDIWYSHASKEEQLLYKKSLLEEKCAALKKTYEEQIGHLEETEQALNKLKGCSYPIEKFDLEFLTKFFANDTTFITKMCQQKENYYLHVLAEVCSRVLQNQKHPFHKKISQILKDKNSWESKDPSISHIGYLGSKGAFSDSLLIHANILPSVKEQKARIQEKFDSEIIKLQKKIELL